MMAAVKVRSTCIWSNRQLNGKKTPFLYLNCNTAMLVYTLHPSSRFALPGARSQVRAWGSTWNMPNNTNNCSPSWAPSITRGRQIYKPSQPPSSSLSCRTTLWCAAAQQSSLTLRTVFLLAWSLRGGGERGNTYQQ